MWKNMRLYSLNEKFREHVSLMMIFVALFFEEVLNGQMIS